MAKSIRDQKFTEQAKQRQKLVSKVQEKAGTGGLGQTVSKIEAARARRRRQMEQF